MSNQQYLSYLERLIATLNSLERTDPQSLDELTLAGFVYDFTKRIADSAKGFKNWLAYAPYNLILQDNKQLLEETYMAAMDTLTALLVSLNSSFSKDLEKMKETEIVQELYHLFDIIEKLSNYLSKRLSSAFYGNGNLYQDRQFLENSYISLRTALKHLSEADYRVTQYGDTVLRDRYYSKFKSILGISDKDQAPHYV